jgi:CheY-like chemotaxis protein
VNSQVLGLGEILQRTLGESIQIQTRLQENLWPALTDANQLDNAILNLAINSRDAMRSGGELTIETRNQTFSFAEASQLEGAEAGDYVAVAVSDTGCGMTPETVSKVFEPFFTTKPIGQGTGLGLSMIYGFVKQSGGHIQIKSEVGKGTSVTIFLRRAEQRKEGSLVSRSADVPVGRGETVLLVEDDQSVRLLVMEVLEELQYRLIEASDATEAVPLLQSDQRIDLLITDVGLPHIDGRQLADIARVSRPDLKVLFITGYAAKARVQSHFLAPGMEMMTKPFDLDALAARIRQLIDRK